MESPVTVNRSATNAPSDAEAEAALHVLGQQLRWEAGGALFPGEPRLCYGTCGTAQYLVFQDTLHAPGTWHASRLVAPGLRGVASPTTYPTLATAQAACQHPLETTHW